MKRAGVVAALSSVAAALVVALLPWGGPPAAAFERVKRVQLRTGDGLRPLSEDDGRRVIERLRACASAGMIERLQRCDAGSGATVTWDASGYPVTATVSDTAVWLRYPPRLGVCGGRYLLNCTVSLPEPTKIELPPSRSDVVSLRAHAEMLSVLAGRSADPGWLDDLDALPGTTTFLVSAAGDEVGYRVEGSGRPFLAAMRAIAARRMPGLVERASGWSDEGHSAVEVVLGHPGWTRVETTGTVATARARLSGWMPPDPLGRVLDRYPPLSPLWVGLWSSEARTGAVVAHREQPGIADVIVDGEISTSSKRKDRKIENIRGLRGGDALGCIDTLTAAGVSGHGARLGKVFAELGATGCVGVRELGWGAERRWIVEIAAR